MALPRQAPGLSAAMYHCFDELQGAHGYVPLPQALIKAL